MNCNLFTYGSLMFAPIWERVVQRPYRSAAAVLKDHARLAIKNAAYPGMIARQGSQVEGLLYFDIDPGDIAVLDAFEGAAYQRSSVQTVLANGTIIAAETYIYTDRPTLLDHPWEPQYFQIESFLHAYFRSELK